jgi:hypothetical protein
MNPRFPVWGAKYLFDGLDLEKGVPDDAEPPNIGSIRIPEDKDQLGAELLKILFAHEWETDVNDDYLANLGVTHAPQALASSGTESGNAWRRVNREVLKWTGIRTIYETLRTSSRGKN